MKNPKIAREVAQGFKKDGWRLFQTDKGRWQGQRRADWKGNELYEDADADTLVRLAAKIRGVKL